MHNFILSYRLLLTRLAIFLFLFLITSSLIGSWIIPTPLLYQFHFFIYGNLGKVLLFSIIIFFLLTRDQKPTFPTPPPITLIHYLMLIFSVLLLPLFYTLSRQLLTYSSAYHAPLITIATHLILMTIPALQLLALFGLHFFTQTIHRYKKELLICLLISTISYAAIFYVWQFWPFFSHGVLLGLQFILSLLYTNIFFIPPNTLIAQNFAVEIAQACSGLDSLAFFSIFYLFIGILERRRFNKLKYFLILPIALLGLYITNILRVLLLILIGIHISPALAIGLFHTYAGMVLFLIYFVLFWKFSYRWLIKNQTKS